MFHFLQERLEVSFERHMSITAIHISIADQLQACILDYLLWLLVNSLTHLPHSKANVYSNEPRFNGQSIVSLHPRLPTMVVAEFNHTPSSFERTSLL